MGLEGSGNELVSSVRGDTFLGRGKGGRGSQNKLYNDFTILLGHPGGHKMKPDYLLFPDMPLLLTLTIGFHGFLLSCHAHPAG